MSRSGFYLATLFFILGCTPVFGATKQITIASDIWCPVLCDPAKGHEGFGIDAVRRIFEPQGYKIEVKIMPWAEAVGLTELGKMNAIIGANYEDAPSFKFATHALATNTTDFYVLADSKLKITDIDSLEGKKVGVIKGYAYANPMMKFITAHEGKATLLETVGDDALGQNIQKLLDGKIDVLVESDLIMRYVLHDMKLEDKIIKQGTSLPMGELFIAFSPALRESSDDTKLYDDGLQRLKSSGELQKIYSTYHASAPP